MLEPLAAAPALAAPALAAVARALAAEADAIPLPQPLVDGWASLAAAEYQVAVARAWTPLLHLRAALHEAAAALETPR